MKRISLLVLSSFIIVISARSGETDSLSRNKFKYSVGVVASPYAFTFWNVSSFEDDSKIFDNTLTLSAPILGLFAEYRFLSFFGFRIGARLTKEGTKFQTKDFPIGYTNSIVFQNKYIEIPLNVLLYLPTDKDGRGSFVFKIGVNMDWIYFQKTTTTSFVMVDPALR